MKHPMLIDSQLLDKVSAEASASPRLRKNFNFHQNNNDLAHRLLNAIEPGSYIVPHRHLDPNKDETMIVIRGRLGVVLFDETGQITQVCALEAGGVSCGITIPHGVFHTALALQPGTVMFECKAGPFMPLDANELAPWAPPEGGEGTAAYAQSLSVLFSNLRAPG